MGTLDRWLARNILSLTAASGISRACCHWDWYERIVLFPFLRDPFIAELMSWINALWERLIRALASAVPGAS